MSSLPRPSQKHKILQAALESFAELGYDATRVRHVADRAGVSEAALYRHYPSMQALAQELFTHHFAGFAAQLDEATSAGTRYPLEILEHVIVAGQVEQEFRAGQPNLLAAIFLGCLLQPIVLTNLAAPGAMVLIGDTKHDQVIEDAAIAALRIERV